MEKWNLLWLMAEAPLCLVPQSGLAGTAGASQGSSQGQSQLRPGQSRLCSVRMAVEKGSRDAESGFAVSKGPAAF